MLGIAELTDIINHVTVLFQFILVLVQSVLKQVTLIDIVHLCVPAFVVVLIRWDYFDLGRIVVQI